jgi:hypothetical protein
MLVSYFGTDVCSMYVCVDLHAPVSIRLPVMLATCFVARIANGTNLELEDDSLSGFIWTQCLQCSLDKNAARSSFQKKSCIVLRESTLGATMRLTRLRNKFKKKSIKKNATLMEQDCLYSAGCRVASSGGR